jgi:hypothetical protein
MMRQYAEPGNFASNMKPQPLPSRDANKTRFDRGISGALLAISSILLFTCAEKTAGADWQVGTPIVTYWCGPALTDTVADQMKKGGFNLVWCDEKSLDVAQRHGLRAQLQDALLNPASLDDPARKEQLDQLIARVSKHPALYDYFITDEPGAAQFAALGRLVKYLRERDPAHLAYINLFPTYANNDQLGTKGDTVAAYQKYLDEFIGMVKPGLVSYDHYQFALTGDNSEYFLNLAMVRKASIQARLPFLNIVQASTWAPKVMRVPGPDEMRYLVYTTLAYGAQGISYYIYSCANHLGGIANADGTPTALYDPLTKLNHEFAAIASELQPLHSLVVYHAGMQPPGAVPLPKHAAFTIDPMPKSAVYKAPERATGVLLGYFGRGNDASHPTHVLVVNLDYKAESTFTIHGPGALEVFNPETAHWSSGSQHSVEVTLKGGSGKLIRLKR